MEQDVINYLTGDPNLRDLLEGSLSNTKIYPIQAPDGAEPPYIVYDTTSDGTVEENLLERSLSFNCVANTEIEAREIRDKIINLLDYQDKIRRKIASTTYWFYWAKHVGGTNYKDPTLDLFYHPVVVSFKYARITIEDMETIVKLVDKLGEWIDQDNPLFVADRPSETILEPAILTGVTKDSWVTLITYEVTDKELWLDQIIVTGNAPCEVSIFVNTSEKVPVRTSHQDRTAAINFKPAAKFPVGTIIDIKVRHSNDATAEFKGCLNGHKY